MTVLEVAKDIFRHPVVHFIKRWNWKAAVTSATLRGTIFFSANLTAGWRAALGAMLAEFTWRTLLSGFYGSATQSFRRAEPAWAASLVVMIVLPATSHVIEFFVHWLRGTPNLVGSIVASLIFTVVATLFNLYAMRRGVLVVDEEKNRPLSEDLKAMPRLLVSFVAAGPLALWRLTRDRR